MSRQDVFGPGTVVAKPDLTAELVFGPGTVVAKPDPTAELVLVGV